MCRYVCVCMYRYVCVCMCRYVCACMYRHACVHEKECFVCIVHVVSHVNVNM